MILETIIAALVPVGAEAVKQLVNKFVGGVKPTTVAEQIELDRNDVERIRALAELDTPIGQPSQWVVDLRASARYVGALAVIFVGIFGLFTPIDDSIKAMGLEAANIAFGFLFGSRIVSHWKSR
jgi:hypothetical protein